MARAVISRLLVLPLMLCATLSIASAAEAEHEDTPREDAPWSVAELMRNLAQVKNSRATFVEHKHLSMLTTPLKFSGTLEYIAPGRLEKHTLLPKPESLILDQDKLVVQQGEAGKKRTLSLQDYPSIWAFVESIRSTLAGDIGTLNRFYHVTLKGQPKQWQLMLNPVDSKMQSLVSEILIKGSLEQIRTIEIRETSGDYSVMNISKDDS
ncbi:MAG: outer membrane lipoprotein carrier protein LolA [Gallionella sp.]|nr:outer membrane lipoprotein carrier protein LolA [Gallionella sp.]